MAARGKKRDRIEDELAGIVALSDAPEADVVPALRRALRERSSLVAERAALLARERSLTQLAPDLVSAFERFKEDAVKRDPGCRAKQAALEALDVLDANVPETFLAAARYVQLEPQWGRPADTAVGVRARAILALARWADRDAPLLAGELLVDQEWPVRQAAAEALGLYGERAPAAALVVALAREEEPEVMTSCMQSLLRLAPDWGLPWLRTALSRAGAPLARECALLALAQSGRDDALTAILEHLEAEVHAPRREEAIRALGLHRTERALAALLGFIAEGSLTTAKAATAALAARRFDPGVYPRVAEAVRQNGARALAAVFAEVFHDVADRA
jgi:HEAT repeat protein